jgi:glyoxylase-like metal-dependent hydrolase (beta-lactamase superfamily II)
MTSSPIHTLDLEFRGLTGAIAVYLIPHPGGAALVECGPGSTLPALEKGLAKFGFSFADITDVLLTHIHLDHAGAAGFLARQGARVHVHRVGAPHLISPEKLLESAGRIYGELMEPLWGEFLSVPQPQLSVLQDGEEVRVEGHIFRAVDTPGHANHHFAYIFEDTCFSGDIGGIRLAGLRYLRLPMPPPEFHLEKWRDSLEKLRREYSQGAFTRIAPTHFGIYEDAGWHLDAMAEALDEVSEWIEKVMPAEPEIQNLRALFTEWTNEVSIQKGLDENLLSVQEAANPSFMSADGIQRYWRKYRTVERKA